jgi:hypothetical protein
VVEQLIRNQQVVSSILTVGSTHSPSASSESARSKHAETKTNGNKKKKVDITNKDVYYGAQPVTSC